MSTTYNFQIEGGTVKLLGRPEQGPAFNPNALPNPDTLPGIGRWERVYTTKAAANGGADGGKALFQQAMQ